MYFLLFHEWRERNRSFPNLSFSNALCLSSHSLLLIPFSNVQLSNCLPLFVHFISFTLSHSHTLALSIFHILASNTTCVLNMLSEHMRSRIYDPTFARTTYLTSVFFIYIVFFHFLARSHLVVGCMPYIDAYIISHTCYLYFVIILTYSVICFHYFSYFLCMLMHYQ